jgi:hypothetical protein
MRRALYCAGVCVAAAHAGVAEAELAALRALLGAKQAPAVDDVGALRGELDGLLASWPAPAWRVAPSWCST